MTNIFHNIKVITVKDTLWYIWSRGNAMGVTPMCTMYNVHVHNERDNLCVLPGL